MNTIIIKAKIMLVRFLSIFIREDAYRKLGFYSYKDEPIRCHYCGNTSFNYRRRKYKRGRLIGAKCYCDACGKQLGFMKDSKWTIIGE